jgi:hypothetical protein
MRAQGGEGSEEEEEEEERTEREGVQVTVLYYEYKRNLEVLFTPRGECSSRRGQCKGDLS